MREPKVWLVGAGPGDPGLISLRGAELLGRCDCVVYDYLVNPELLAQVPASAARHYVGKKGRSTSTPQAEIEALLLDCARRHRCVVRLKGGDPFVFGRGGEEAAALVDAGIPFAVVPGITSGIAAPAYAGIPITHRATASAVAFVTGHQQEGADGFDWSTVASVETVVLYMGMHHLRRNCDALIAAGRDPATPVAVIQWGTWAKQRTVVATLADIPERAAEAGLGAPAITVVGDVVGWRARLRWADDRPLSGRRVLVTRPRTHAGALSGRLSALGAEVLHLPLAELVREPPQALASAIAALPPGSWIACASAEAVHAVLDAVVHAGRDARMLGSLRLAAVGPGTSDAFRMHGLRADLVPATADAGHLAQALIAAGPAAAVLLPRADNAGEELERTLAAAGLPVVPVIAYRAVPLPVAAVPEADACVVASSATARRLAAALGDAGLRHWRERALPCFAIGPRTAATLRELGFTVAATAQEATVESLADAVVAALG